MEVLDGSLLVLVLFLQIIDLLLLIVDPQLLSLLLLFFLLQPDSFSFQPGVLFFLLSLLFLLPLLDLFLRQQLRSLLEAGVDGSLTDWTCSTRTLEWISTQLWCFYCMQLLALVEAIITALAQKWCYQVFQLGTRIKSIISYGGQRRQIYIS